METSAKFGDILTKRRERASFLSRKPKFLEIYSNIKSHKNSFSVITNPLKNVINIGNNLSHLPVSGGAMGKLESKSIDWFSAVSKIKQAGYPEKSLQIDTITKDAGSFDNYWKLVLSSGEFSAEKHLKLLKLSSDLNLNKNNRGGLEIFGSDR